ncbi:MAG: hypothetical protein ACI4RD_04185 [Kiritimatiellia bacterium]
MDKQERFVAKLAKQLEEARAADAAGTETASLEEGLFKQKKTLNEMREAVSRIGKEKTLDSTLIRPDGTVSAAADAFNAPIVAKAEPMNDLRLIIGLCSCPSLKTSRR